MMNDQSLSLSIPLPCIKCLVFPVCKSKLCDAYNSNETIKSILTYFECIKELKHYRELIMTDVARYFIYSAGIINHTLIDKCSSLWEYVPDDMTTNIILEILDYYNIYIPLTIKTNYKNPMPPMQILKSTYSLLRV